jgi:hypothetical protein
MSERIWGITLIQIGEGPSRHFRADISITEGSSIEYLELYSNRSPDVGDILEDIRDFICKSVDGAA